MTITAQATNEPDDREQALADIAAALGRLGHQTTPEDPVAVELAKLRAAVASLKVELAARHCHGQCGCWHVTYTNYPTMGAAPYYPLTGGTYTIGSTAINTGGYYTNTTGAVPYVITGGGTSTTS